jgi:hypothetical protein
MTFKKNNLADAINRVIHPENITEIPINHIIDATKSNVLQNALSKLTNNDSKDKKTNH